MATLSGKTTSGQAAWIKYVKNNPKSKDIDFIVEHKMEATMLDERGEYALRVLPEKTAFKIISTQTKNISGKEFAIVSYKGVRGLIPIARIRKPTTTDVLKEEAMALANLDKKIKEIVKTCGPFDLVIKGDPQANRVYKNIAGARDVKEKVMGREAKSDFNIVSTTGDAIFISHKKAGGAEAFQQYGGLTPKAGLKINQHPEVISFLRKTVNYIENDRLQNPVYTYVTDPLLINLAVYGSEYGRSAKFGIENVTIIGQGDPILRALPRKENTFELDFSHHLVHNGIVKDFQTGDYQAVLGATYRAGRGFDLDGKRYTGARVGIYPRKLIINRSGATEI